MWEKIAHSDGTGAEFEYRLDGALVRAKNESAEVFFERDEVGRVVKERQGDFSVSSRYGEGGEREGVESSLGARMGVRWDKLGGVAALYLGAAAREAGTPTISLERDALGMEVARELPGGVRVEWRRDLAARPLQRRTLRAGAGGMQEVEARTYRWRGEDQIAAIVDTALGATHYQHDARGRLVAQQRGEHVLHRAMDAVGNIYRSPRLDDRRYGPGGRLQEAEGVRYIQDEDGNLTEKHTPQGTWRYGWNGAGLLAEVERPDGTRVQFSYDALARRTLKVVLSAEAQGRSAPKREVRFVWDGLMPLHELAAEGGLTTWYFEPESFSPLAKEDTTGRYTVVTDHLEAPTEMYDELGQLAWRMQLDAFGAGKADVALQHCPWRWPGQYEDEETGLLYNRFRYYDAYAGRYISQDPLGPDAGPSLYGYPEDPLSATDPLGLIKSCTPTEKPKPGEPLYVGSYSSSRYGNLKTGRNKDFTPHHAIQHAATGVSHGRGITINIPKTVHEKTSSFRKPLDTDLAKRQHLARDVRELRQLLGEAGYDPQLVRQQLQELIKQNKDLYKL